jgi:hypothetical protein
MVEGGDHASRPRTKSARVQVPRNERRCFEITRPLDRRKLTGLQKQICNRKARASESRESNKWIRGQQARDLALAESARLALAAGLKRVSENGASWFIGITPRVRCIRSAAPADPTSWCREWVVVGYGKGHVYYFVGSDLLKGAEPASTVSWAEARGGTQVTPTTARLKQAVRDAVNWWTELAQPDTRPLPWTFEIRRAQV